MQKINSLLTNKILILVILSGLILRFVGIFHTPPSLYWDEISIGYNSYTISETLKDEHGRFLPIEAFTAYGDYKAPLYIYLTAPIVKIFGLNYLSVRAISIISGTLLILVVFLLSKELFPKNKPIHIISSIFIAISPWSMQISRAAFEANLGVLLATVATLFFLKAYKKPYLIILSAVMFVLSMYSFNGTRYFLPFWITALALWMYFSHGRKVINSKHLALSCLLGIIMIIPLIIFGLTNSGQLRYNEVNIFSDPQPVIESNRLQKEKNYSFVSKIIYNRRVFHAKNYIKHYFDSFSYRYLFATGDVNPRFSSQQIGQLYLIEIILLPMGAYFLYKKYKKTFYFLALWVIISPIAASVARETPHALRTLQMLPPLTIISSSGILFLINIKNSKLIKIGLSIIVLSLIGYQFSSFIFDYFTSYSAKYSEHWQDGYSQLSESLNDQIFENKKILITDYYGRAYANMLYYNKISLNEYLTTRDAFSEPSGLWTVKAFGSFIFKPTVSCSDASMADYLVGTPKDFSDTKAQSIVLDSFGKPKFVIINTNECKK